MRLGGDVKIPVSDELDELDELDAGVAKAPFVASLGRVSCLRPARLVAKYSHVMPRFAQRAQVGFSLLHLTLDAAQGWQLSRSLGTAGIVDRRAGAGWATASGEGTAAMAD